MQGAELPVASHTIRARKSSRQRSSNPFLKGLGAPKLSFRCFSATLLTRMTFARHRAGRGGAGRGGAGRGGRSSPVRAGGRRLHIY